jgi:glutathione peroxidase
VASIHKIRIEGINGNELELSQFKGKKLLIVNVASACGFTPQYEQLERLYRQYSAHLSILGCPCNDFGGQEPGDEEEIMDFCKTLYDVSFPLTSKINIQSQPVHPLYKWLTRKTENGVADKEVTWNFQKFAIDPNGHWQRSFPPSSSPFDDEIIRWIEAP